MNNNNFNQRLRIAGWCACASAVVSGFGVVFLAALYVGFFTGNAELLGFGTLNDLCIIIQYLLALPVLVAFHRIISPQSPRASTVATLMGLVGILIVVGFQVLLIAGVMTFSDQVVFASAGLLVIGGWILIISYRLQVTTNLRNGLLLGILGFLYVGYPVWAFVIGRRLLSGRWTAIEQNLSLSGETA